MTLFTIVAPIFVFTAPIQAQEEPIVFKAGFYQWGDWGTWDYAKGGPTALGAYVTAQVMEGLYRYDPWVNEGEGGYVGVLAVNWTLINRTTWLIDLRQNVKFHDGTPFNASAAMWSLERIYTINRDPSGPLYTTYTRPIAPLRPYDELVDDWDVTWVPDGGRVTHFNRTEWVSEYSFYEHFNWPAGSVPLDFVCYSPTYYAGFEAECWDDNRQSLVCTGPFKYESFDVPNGIFHLKRFDD
ncbi:MAG: ABC transporter substrate-binding protein, partial [Promethearchaeota archaeon]